MIYVLDSSFVAAQIIPDERNPFVERLYAKIKPDDEKIAPQLIWYEMANLLNNLIRRRRYIYDTAIEFFPFLAGMGLICDNVSGTEYAKKLFRLCSDYNLSSYDAAYLELAERKKAVLCTMDNNLRAAAKKYGVAVLK